MKETQDAYWGTHLCEIVAPNIDGKVRIRWVDGHTQSTSIEMFVDQLRPIGDVARELLKPRPTP